MQNILGFLVSTPGRAIRLIVAAGMIVYGLFFAGSIIGYGFAAVGLVIFAITAGDTCIFAPLFGFSADGKLTRSQLHKASH
jgi:hypothetical protein